MGDSLVEMRDISAAIVCYILSQNACKVLEIWKKRAIHHIQKKESTREVALADLLQKFILMKLALESAKNKGVHIESDENFNQIMYEVGNYMTSDENAAIMYIKYLRLSNNTTIDVAALNDRLYKAHENAMYGRCQPTQLPFQVERIRAMVNNAGGPGRRNNNQPQQPGPSHPQRPGPGPGHPQRPGPGPSHPQRPV